MKFHTFSSSPFLLALLLLASETLYAASGDLDPTFVIGLGANGRVKCLALQADGKILIGGHFTVVNGTNRNYIARLNADGELDDTFSPLFGPDYDVDSIAVQADGTMLIGGEFIHVDGYDRGYIARLKTDGRVDNNSFNISHQANGSVTAIAVQTDGKIVVGGSFTGYGFVSCPYVARLETNGTLDFGFSTNVGANAAVNTVVLQPDGRMLLGGYFTQVNGTNRNYVARLDVNGNLDDTFNAGAGPNGPVFALALQPDGKVVLGGGFTMINGTNRKSVARLNVNGSLDASFDPGTGPDGWIFSLAIQPSGQIVIGGTFSYVDGTNQYYLARLNADGGLDDGFFSGEGPNSYVYSLFKAKDGKLLVGGEFTQVNGTSRNHYTRLLGDPVTLKIESRGPKMVITWTDPAFVLQSAPSLTGLFTNMESPNSPYTNSVPSPVQYFRLKAKN